MTKHSSNIAVVILAAGASSRMGKPKQLLDWGGSTLLRHAIKTIKEVKVADIVVVLGAHSETVAHSIQDDSISAIVNSNWHMGLGSSIACAVSHILESKQNMEGVLFVLADQPFVTPIYIENMLARFKNGEAMIIGTSYDNNKMGVPALFDSSYFSELALLNGDNGAKDVLIKQKEKLILLNPGFENIDIDTKEDYRRVLKQLRAANSSTDNI
ncbi:nucleotidyltransferase family protein [Algibacter mikhailovii]|uniref:MobA-like NTP transferase domain-containing protein n=1 Tax=Algibacter mikhailovii TaxID=425498 RepID=A0A918VER8_9FLAO|nr:nucleotidyltransferase family protein [Algibacter mikhailovii]GGZ92580.1 hypothetical protein GCM10007028_33660 [Algibacter mikhailovii]